MRNAESPGLRQKITEFGLRRARDQTPSTEWDGIIQGIEKRTWDVLVKNTKLPTLRERARTEREQLVQPRPEKPNTVEENFRILTSRYAEDVHLHFKQENDSSQGAWDVNELILASQSALASDQRSLAYNHPFSPGSSEYQFTQTSETYHTPTARAELQEIDVRNPWPVNNFEIGDDRSGSYHPIYSEFPNQVEDDEHFVEPGMNRYVRHDLGSFRSFDDWASQCGQGIKERRFADNVK